MRNNALDLAGRRFGRLTAIKIIGRTKQYNNIWLCKCDCGKESKVSTANLKAKRPVKSCGCYAKDNPAFLKHGHTRNGKTTLEYKMWSTAKHRSKRDNIPFNIEVSDIVVPEFCPIFGMKLESGEKFSTINSPTLDRLIPDKGYVKGNIKVISLKANSLKKNASVTDLKNLVNWLEKETQ